MLSTGKLTLELVFENILKQCIHILFSQNTWIRHTWKRKTLYKEYADMHSLRTSDSLQIQLSQIQFLLHGIYFPSRFPYLSLCRSACQRALLALLNKKNSNEINLKWRYVIVNVEPCHGMNLSYSLFLGLSRTTMAER